MGIADKLKNRLRSKNSQNNGEAIPNDDVLVKEKEEVVLQEKDIEKSAVPEEQERIQWSSPREFLFTCIGYSVGLGNVWRFPYLCYKSGGGAFLIPYIIMMLLIGMPLLFMEYAFGQYFGVGSLSIFKKVCPLLQGIGIGYTVLNGLVCIYYNVIIALSLFYLFSSMQASLPWGSCGHWWNTPTCGHPVPQSDEPMGNLSALVNGTSSLFNSSYDDYGGNFSMWGNATRNATIRTSPSDEFFKFAVLDMHPEHNISNLGHIQWKLCLCLLLAWILVAIFVSRGIQSTGKVAYFTATFPYLMLTILVVRGVTLPGASKGLMYFLMPDWTQLGNPEIWFGAASQLFYSTNLAWGGMITMASYNGFDHNCYRDAIVINIVSFCTSLYAGLAVFSIIGYMADENNLEVSEVIDSGPGLAFVVYPYALSQLPVAPLFSVLFFFMLFLLGIGSQMVDVETVMTGLMDEFPRARPHRFKVLVIVCIIFFFTGLPLVTQGGMYVLQLMDWYSASFCVLIIAVVECVAINWIYGMPKFASNVKEMLGIMPPLWWRICWKYISPLLILSVLVFSLVKYKPAEYGNELYPVWADGLGWCMTMASVIPIPAVAIYKFYHAEGSGFMEKWLSSTKPNIEIEIKVRPLEDDAEEKEEKERLRQMSGDTNGDATHEKLLQHHAAGGDNKTVTSPI